MASVPDDYVDPVETKKAEMSKKLPKSYLKGTVNYEQQKSQVEK